jgi:tetratricopeptide (TPR) repeat protein
MAPVLGAREPAGWSAAHSAHFTIYSNAGAEAAGSLAAGLERLHDFFVRQTGLSPAARREVRVICFASAGEYAQYRSRPGTDAHFIGAEDRDYIVLAAPPRGDPRHDLRTAAHEYAHVLIHSGGWKLPEWIAEGVSDVVSTVQLRERESRIGGDLPGRSAALKARWLPLSDLFAFRLSAAAADAERTGLFYAESWAVADLLMLSPAYRSRFPALLAALASGVSAEAALAEVYAVSPQSIERDARARLARGTQAVPLPAVAGGGAGIRVEAVTPFAARAVLADLRFVNGEPAAAEFLYRALLEERPSAAEIHAALGTIALRRGDTGAAFAAWKRAVDLGITDAALCFRYATLADERSPSSRAALERAIALRPDFDDARFKLALMEKNAGHAEAAVAQLRAMREIAPLRAFAYWSALADALLDLGRRGEARQAAGEARAHAANGEEREHAATLEWMADTELAVEIEGQKFHTVRVPIGGAARNPFIEPGDHAKRVEATLRRVDCAEDGGSTLLMVETAEGTLTLAIPDPSRVEIRNAGGAAFEFTCGPQEARRVLVEYAATKVLRGLEFR